MDLPEYREAAQRLEAIQEQIIAVERELSDLYSRKVALEGSVMAMMTVVETKADLDTIKPEKGFTGAVKGITVEQVEQLKEMALQGVQDKQRADKLAAENKRLQGMVPSTKERMKMAQEQQQIEQENRRLSVDNALLQEQLNRERRFSKRLLDGVVSALDFLEEHLPEQFRQLIKNARQLIPVPDLQEAGQEMERSLEDIEL